MNIDKIIRHTYARVRCQDRALMSCQKMFELTARKATEAPHAITTDVFYEAIFRVSLIKISGVKLERKVISGLRLLLKKAVGEIF